jgi:hypothetical protein
MLYIPRKIYVVADKKDHLLDVPWISFSHKLNTVPPLLPFATKSGFSLLS